MAGFACGSDRSASDLAQPPDRSASDAAQPPDRSASDVRQPPSAGSGAKPAPTNIVSNADIRRTRPGTPARSIMTWAQAVQYGDLPAVESAYTQRVREMVGLRRVSAAARLVSSLLGKPEIVRATVRGTVALVRVALVSFDAADRRFVQPTTFRLRRERGVWLLDEAGVLLDSAAALRRAAG